MKQELSLKTKLPQNCHWGNLSEATDNWKEDIVSGPFGSNLLTTDYQSNGTPIIRLQNIQRFQFLNKDIKYVNTAKADELKRHSFKAGDLVLAKLGDPIGKTCIAPESLKEGIIVADVVRIRISKKYVTKYFEYCLNSNLVLNQLTKGIVGSTRPRVNLDNIRNILLPIPEADIQKQISAKLDKQMTQIEILRKEVENVNNANEYLATSVLKNIFDCISFKPQDYKMLSEITKVTSGMTPLRSNPDYYGGTIPWIQTGELRNNNIYDTKEKITESALEQTTLKLNPIDTLLIAMYGQGKTRGKTGLVKIQATTNQASCAIHPNYELFIPEYLQVCFISNYQNDTKKDNQSI